MSEIITHINQYTVKVKFTGDRPSPMDPNNFNCNVVRVTNDLTGNSNFVLLWAEKCKDKSDAMFTFYKVLHSVMVGALSPEQFCNAMCLDPESHQAEVLFAFCRDNCARMAPIINDKSDLNKTMHMIEQKLGIKRKANGS